MSDTNLIERAVVVDGAPIAEDPTHYVCDIHDNLAVCGEPMDADADFVDSDDPAECPNCVLAVDSGVECFVPGCPGRRGLVRALIHRLTGGRRG